MKEANERWMSDLPAFLTMLANSEEIYNVIPIGEGRKIEFPLRGTSFYFTKEGKFDKISKLKSE